jgi:conjugative transfer signal peptidase TraF
MHIKQRYPIFLLIAFLVVASLVYKSGLILNVTPSMKRGLYLSQKGIIGRGDIVSACLIEPYKQVGIARNYIEKGEKCNGSDPLIKQVIAVPGDDVMLTDSYIEVNGDIYPYKTYYQDSLQRPLAVYPRGKYFKTKGYWLIGNHDMKSWDSRYWGPVSKEQIISKLKPVLTW